MYKGLPESWDLEPVIQLKESQILLSVGVTGVL